MPFFEDVAERVRATSDGCTAEFKGVVLSSVFQPVFGLAHGRALGYEGLIRGRDSHGTPVGPAAVFGLATTRQELIFLDTLCRVLHARNFARLSTDYWLFLNVNPSAMSFADPEPHRAFSRAMAGFGIPANRVVIEVLEAALHRDIARVVDFYREQGYLVAVDDFGSGHSNLDRVWRMKPDIVKLDRALLVHIAEDSTSRMFLGRMVQTMHEAGSLVLLEGIESEAEAVIAMDTEIDFTQGYYFGRPVPDLTLPPDVDQKFKLLYRQFHRIAVLESKDFRAEVGPYGHELKRAAGLMEEGASFYQAVREFLSLPHAERCYLLDDFGCQVGSSALSSASQSKLDPRFEPVTREQGSYWGHRHYFRRALKRFGEVQQTRPYLSVPTARKCVTVSIALRCNDAVYVLCGDMSWGRAFSTDITLV